MENYFKLLEKNKTWAENVVKDDPDFFRKRLDGQQPHFLFIGCSDSRVPANTLTGADPGDMFVHRNIANQVHPNDLNVLSVLQFAVEVLDVKHVIVCGHYECGGVKAGTTETQYGLVDNWLAQIRQVKRLHQRELETLPDDKARINRMVELNVLWQIYNLTLTPCIRNAWARGRRPLLHGLVYSLADGRLKEVIRGVDGPDKAEALAPML